MKRPAPDYKQRARRRAAEMKEKIWYKPVEGENTVRILPTPLVPGKKKESDPISEEVWTEYGIHRKVGPKNYMVRCGKHPVTGMGECWLCDVQIPKLKNRGLDKKAAKLAPERTLLIQIAKVVEDDDGNVQYIGPKLWTPTSGKLLGDLYGSYLQSNRVDYADPKKGRNLSFTRTGSGLDTRYPGGIQADEESSAIPKSLLRKVLPFSEIKEIPLYDEARQRAAYIGEDYKPDREGDRRDMAKKRHDEDEEEVTPKSKKKKKDDDEDEEEEVEEDDDDSDDDDEDPDLEDDEDEDEPPAKKKGAKSGKKKLVEEDDDDDDDTDEDDEEEEEDEDEAPPKKSKKVVKASKKKAVEEEDEDDEDDDEDEEEEEPAPKKKGSVKASKKTAKDEEDDTDEDEEDDDEPPVKKSEKVVTKKSKKVVEEDDEDEDTDDDEEEEEEPATKKKAVKKGKK